MREYAIVLVLGAALLAAIPAAAQSHDPHDADATTATAPTAAPSVGAEASPVTVGARLEPDTTTIGTPFRYTMEITAPVGVQVVFAQPTERLGDFDILDFGDVPPATGAGTTVITRWYKLAGWEAGHHEIESPPVQWRRAGGELTTAPAAKVVMTIESVLTKAGEPNDIRDIKPPEEPPFEWRPYYVVAAAVATIVMLAALAYRFLRRRDRAAIALPPRPAHEVAIEDLERLRGRGLTDHGLFKEYYSALSGIVRAYLERRFGLRAPEMTTEEFLLTSARGGRLQSGHRALLAEFLSESDLVKFARHVPTLVDAERAWAAARKFVDETAERPAADGRTGDGDGPARDARPPERAAARRVGMGRRGATEDAGGDVDASR